MSNHIGELLSEQKLCGTLPKASKLLFNPVVESSTHQFVMVATAAPFVLIGSELISVGYSQGTPSMPTPNEAKYRKKNAMLDKCQLTNRMHINFIQPTWLLTLFDFLLIARSL